MSERRCETCQHFVGWPHAFSFERQGVCTVPRADVFPSANREVNRWSGQKCQMWTATPPTGSE